MKGLYFLKWKAAMLSVSVVVAACMLSACSKDDSASPEPGPDPVLVEAEYTVMFYAVGDDNLSTLLMTTLEDLKKMNSTEQVNVTAQVKLGKHWQTADDQKAVPYRGVNRFVLPKAGEQFKLENLGDASMPFSTPESLASFLEWSKENYPARNYILVLWGHGDGWNAAKDVPHGTKGCLPDNNIDERFMANIDVEKALKDAGVHLRVLDFYCCNMARMEALCEYSQVADYARMTNEPITGDGHETAELVRLLQNAASSSPDSDLLIEEVWKDYLNYLLAGWEKVAKEINWDLQVSVSFVDMRKSGALVNDAKELADILVQEYPAHKEIFNKAICQCYCFMYDTDPGNTREYDILDYLRCLMECSKAAGDTQLYDKFSSLYLRMERDVRYMEVVRMENKGKRKVFDYDLSYGVYLASKEEFANYSNLYKDLRFDRITGWSNWLGMNEQVPTGNIAPFYDKETSDSFIATWEKDCGNGVRDILSIGKKGVTVNIELRRMDIEQDTLIAFWNGFWDRPFVDNLPDVEHTIYVRKEECTVMYDPFYNIPSDRYFVYSLEFEGHDTFIVFKEYKVKDNFTPMDKAVYYQTERFRRKRL